MPIDEDVRQEVLAAAPPMGYKSVREMVGKLNEAQRAKNARTARAPQMSQPSSSSYSPRYSTGTSVTSRPATSTVNVNTGPVMQVDNKRYVSMEDFESGLRQVASSTAQTSRSYAGRRYGGIV